MTARRRTELAGKTGKATQPLPIYPPRDRAWLERLDLPMRIGRYKCTKPRRAS